MSSARRLRIVCTNDFLSSLSPSATSYGRLPGGRALRRTVDRLREGQPTIWADAGDFSQGGPLSTTTDGALSFRAAAELGIDVGTLGNHEFDWGLERLQQGVAEVGYPVVCANVDVGDGVPATTMIETSVGSVGFIGLTHPQLAAFTPHAPELDGDLTGLVERHALALRERGAEAVIVLFHFGVNWSTAEDGAHVPDPAPILAITREWGDLVDAVVLGHTLGRWADMVDGVPHAQPWPFGAEVGVIDLDLDYREHRVELVPVPAGDDAAAEAWTGTGCAAIELAERDVLGEIDTPLTINFGDDISLADYAAEALRDAAGATAAVVPVVGMHQPAIEGIMYHWPAGPVTDADISRFWPWTDDRSLVATLSASECAAITAFVAPEPWLAWGTSRLSAPADRPATIVVPFDYADWATVQIAQILGHELQWRVVDVRLRDALRTALGARARVAA